MTTKTNMVAIFYRSAQRQRATKAPQSSLAQRNINQQHGYKVLGYCYGASLCYDPLFYCLAWVKTISPAAPQYPPRSKTARAPVLTVPSGYV